MNKIDSILSKIDETLSSWEFTKRLRGLKSEKTPAEYDAELAARLRNRRTK